MNGRAPGDIDAGFDIEPVGPTLPNGTNIGSRGLYENAPGPGQAVVGMPEEKSPVGLVHLSWKVAAHVGHPHIGGIKNTEHV